MDGWSLVFVDDMSISYKNIYEYLTNFFLDWYAGKENTNCLKTCREIIGNKELSKIDVHSLKPTEQTLDLIYENICEELFRYKYKREYVIALLAFSINLDSYLVKESWYTTERLVGVLSEQLVRTEFDPATMNDSKFHYSSYLMNVPALFLAHMIHKWDTSNCR